MRFPMLVIQNLSRPYSDHTVTAGPACPNCGRAMHLAQIAPRSEGLSRHLVFISAAANAACRYPKAAQQSGRRLTPDRPAQRGTAPGQP